MEDAIAIVRRFNRLVTQRVGALEEDFLGRKRPLGQSRVLYEIGPQGAELRELRGRLGLDSGYLTRLVQGLAAAGLVEIERAAGDERVRRVRWTAAGRAEVGEMDSRSDEGAAALLESLGDRQRQRLVAAMEEVHRLLLATGIRIERIDPDGAAARWCLERYYEELDRRFEGGFDATRSLPAASSDLVPPNGAFLIASVDDRAVGCGVVKRSGPETGSIKRMWVSEEVRGVGLGRRILQGLEAEAAELGFTRVQLETNGALTEAIALYRAAGYREVEPFNDDPYAHHWFEKRIGRAGAET